ncbi:putative porin [Halomonas campaniensis]|uniref:Putative porin n=1 Tax=Halomonas campaniensis TaxID=213554 RepID=A0A7W5K664_9GAMM|nr:porin [Halomonas campaniensis]MBB3332714.1 putative porin [Halomonas campaniensis]
MKKTLLATAIAGAIAASGMAVTNAQAATVYDQDGTKVDVYGRIALGVAGGGPEWTTRDGDRVAQNNDEAFVDVFSRLGLRLSHQVTSDMSAFGRLEWRFRADESGNRNGNNFDAFSETRQAYLGLRSNTWGTIQAGNFDSFFNQAVTIPFDVYIDRGLEFAGHPTQSRGDSIGYITPNLEGFQVYMQAKHYSNRGQNEGANPDTFEDGTTVAGQGGLVYEIDGLRLAAGVVDDVVEGDGGNDELRYGATVSYEFVPGFSARLGYEGRDDNEVNGGGFDTWGLGASYSINQWAFNADIYDVDPDNGDSRTSWALGSYYNVSSAFQVFLELQQADQATVNITLDGLDSDISADGDDVYWLTGARYFF